MFNSFEVIEPAFRSLDLAKNAPVAQIEPLSPLIETAADGANALIRSDKTLGEKAVNLY